VTVVAAAVACHQWHQRLEPAWEAATTDVSSVGLHTSTVLKPRTMAAALDCCSSSRVPLGEYSQQLQDPFVRINVTKVTIFMTILRLAQKGRPRLCIVLLQIHEKYPEATDRRIRFAKVGSCCVSLPMFR
jgi:hypothetical protein